MNIRKMQIRLNAFLKDNDGENLLNIYGKRSYFLGRTIKKFVKCCDLIALNNGCTCWLEKTPLHIRRIDLIKKYIKNIKFIHIIRNGEDSIASHYLISNKFPELWGSGRDLETCVKRWNDDVAISSIHQSDRSSKIIFYNQLINDQNNTLKSICSFINIPFEENMITNRKYGVDHIQKDFESWKDDVSIDRYDINDRKFSNLLTKNEQKYIIENMKIPESFQSI